MFNLLSNTANDYSLDARLIPQSPKTDCSTDSHYRQRFGTCSCDSHCSWDLCRTIPPPVSCLHGTGGVWEWDMDKNAWVAQMGKGIDDVLKFLI